MRNQFDQQLERLHMELIQMGAVCEDAISAAAGALMQEDATLADAAEEAERETVKLKKVEYMSSRIGEEFEGVISSITKWGIYVELPNTIEGLIHVTNLYDDHYNYIEENFEMVGEHTGTTYKLGQTVCVRVIGTDRLQRTIDFEIA